MYCTQCGMKNPHNSNFCKKCGSKFHSDEPEVIANRDTRDHNEAINVRIVKQKNEHMDNYLLLLKKTKDQLLIFARKHLKHFVVFALVAIVIVITFFGVLYLLSEHNRSTRINVQRANYSFIHTENIYKEHKIRGLFFASDTDRGDPVFINGQLKEAPSEHSMARNDYVEFKDGTILIYEDGLEISLSFVCTENRNCNGDRNVSLRYSKVLLSLEEDKNTVTITTKEGETFSLYNVITQDSNRMFRVFEDESRGLQFFIKGSYIDYNGNIHEDPF